MQKIGIMTLMHGFNYGGMLQCYALQEVLRELGFEIEVIDYPPSPRQRLFRRLSSSCLPSKVINTLEGQLWFLKRRKKLWRKFEDFRNKELHLSKRINSRAELKELSQSYDIVLVGSDQVWNQSWFTPEYFLDFPSPGIKRIAYAACCGAEFPIPEARRTRLMDDLKKFDNISVRNEMTLRFVQDQIGISPFIAADPTLLRNWKNLEKPLDIPYEKYILVYILSEKVMGEKQTIIKELARQLNLPIVAVHSDVLQPWFPSFADFELHNPGVFEWMAAFQHAEFVFTDSFHGTIFAVLNQKPLWNCIGRCHSFERIAYAVSRYHIQQAYCNPNEVIDHLEAQKVDPSYYKQVLLAVKEHRSESLHWLQKALKKF